MENRLLTYGTSRSQFSSNGELRLLRMSEETHKSELISALQTNESAATESSSTPDVALLRMKQQTDLAVMEVQAVPPTAGERFRRYLLQKTVGAVGFNVLDAGAKQADTMIQRMTEERVQAAEAQLLKTTGDAASALSERLRKSKLSVGYLQTKSQVTEELIGKLKQQMSNLEKIKTAQIGNKNVLRKQIENLNVALQNSKLISSKTEKEISQSETAGLLSEVQNADNYFEKLFSIHNPKEHPKLQAMIAGYITRSRNPFVLSPGDSEDFEQAMRATAVKMHPDDPEKQDAQLKVMERIAKAFLGREQSGSWRWMYRRLKDIAPGSSIGVTAGVLTGNLLTGGIAGAALLAGSLVTRYAYTRYKYGTKYKSDWEGAQIASYFTSKADKNNSTMIKMLSEKDAAKRIALLKELSMGAKINVSVNDENIELTIASKDEKHVFATNGSQRYAFDLKGYDKNHYFSYIDGKDKEHHMLISSPENGLFSMKESTSTYSLTH